MKIIIYDVEVFRYDFLFGCIILQGNKEILYQTWDQDEVRQFYQDHKDDSIFVGWNSKYYDDIILEAVVKKQDPYLKSKEIIEGNHNCWCHLDFYHWDAMNTGFGSQVSLKLTELIAGKSIDTTEVDFNLDRNLTDEEKKLTESYNQSDLYQTLYNFKFVYDRLELRVGIITTWNLDLMRSLDMTGAQIACEVLEAKKDKSLEFKPVKPILYKNLKIENSQVMDFYLQEKFRNAGYMEIIKIGNADITLGGGGIHQAIKKCYCKKLLYLDVS